MILRVLLEPGPPNWGAAADEGIGGCVVVTAQTRSAVIRRFKSALKAHLEYVREKGVDVPAIDGLEFRELVSA